LKYPPVFGSRDDRTSGVHLDPRVADVNGEGRDGEGREDPRDPGHLFPEPLLPPERLPHRRAPPLRERREDIPLLVWTFARQYGTAFGKPVERIPQETMDALRSYPWPGNIRELRNVIERAVILSDGSTLRVSLAPAAGLVPAGPTTLAAVERQHIAAALQQTGWRIRGADGAARLLGVKPTTLESRIKKLGLQRPHTISGSATGS
jgi:transcriptional regulator with AAA-type ATPase domain